MISLDSSLYAAILIFLVLVFALNFLLFRPLMQVKAERERRTTGMMAEAEKDLAHHRDLLRRYDEAIKNCRMEGYRLQERARAKAAQERAVALAEARERAERLTTEARDSIQTQVLAAKAELDREAREIARGITATILQKSA